MYRLPFACGAVPESDGVSTIASMIAECTITFSRAGETTTTNSETRSLVISVIVDVIVYVIIVNVIVVNDVTGVVVDVIIPSTASSCRRRQLRHR